MTSTPATGMDAVMAGFTTLTTLMGSIWDLMTANPLLALFLAASLAGVGVGIFKMIKGAARR